MQTFQPQVTAIAESNQQLAQVRKPFELPASGGEPVFSHVVCVKHDAPFEYVDVGGCHFAKYAMPSEATYVKNEGKQFFPVIPCAAMTEKQANAILERAKEVEIVIPGRDEENGWKQGFSVKASDWIVLCKQNEWNGFFSASPRIENEKNMAAHTDPLDIKARDRAFAEERKKK